MQPTTQQAFRIEAREKTMIFPTMIEAGTVLVDRGLIPDLNNPLLSLNSAMNSGIIKVIKEDAGRLNFTEFEEINPEERKEEKKPEPKEAPKIKPVNVTVREVREEAPSDAAALLMQLGQFIKPQAAGINSEEVREIIKEELERQEPRRIEVKTEKGTKEIKGLIHKDFEKCLKIVSRGKNLWLYGPAGSGKTHLAVQIAEALNLQFYFIPTSSQSSKIDFLGYNDATGRYIDTPFYQAYKNGGVFLADEIDAANPNVLVTLNAAISNRCMYFGSEFVQMNENFRLIAGANTKGSGATAQFSGRNPIDGATKDRFVYFPFGYDEGLEMNLANNKDFCKKVQALRAKAIKLGSNAIISPRATFDGCDLLEIGFSEAEALDLVIFNKLDENSVNLLKQ